MFVFVVFLHRQNPADCLLWNILTRWFQSLQYINQKKMPTPLSAFTTMKHKTFVGSLPTKSHYFEVLTSSFSLKAKNIFCSLLFFSSGLCPFPATVRREGEKRNWPASFIVKSAVSRLASAWCSTSLALHTQEQERSALSLLTCNEPKPANHQGFVFNIWPFFSSHGLWS